MVWWLVLLIWVVLAILFAIWLGLALKNSDTRDWQRRGRPDRRRRSRERELDA